MFLFFRLSTSLPIKYIKLVTALLHRDKNHFFIGILFVFSLFLFISLFFLLLLFSLLFFIYMKTGILRWSYVLVLSLAGGMFAVFPLPLLFTNASTLWASKKFLSLLCPIVFLLLTEPLTHLQYRLLFAHFSQVERDDKSK